MISAAHMHAFDADFDGEGASSNPPWNEFRGARIFLTGGTGFYGCCLLHTFTQACDRMTLDASITRTHARSRALRCKAPALATHPAVMLIRGDVRSFAFPAGHFSHVLHAATDVVPAPEQQPPELLRETIVEGTRRVLAFGNQSGVKKLLLVSSGFVYGPQPPSVTHMPEDEDAVTRPLPAPSTYVDGKREAERLWRTSEGDSCRTIARCYSSVGPYLPLDAHFAVGNFIRDAARGGPICVSGDGTRTDRICTRPTSPCGSGQYSATAKRAGRTTSARNMTSPSPISPERWQQHSLPPSALRLPKNRFPGRTNGSFPRLCERDPSLD